MIYRIRCAKCGHLVQRIERWNEDFGKLFVMKVYCHGASEEMRVDGLDPLARVIASSRGGVVQGEAFVQPSLPAPPLTVNGQPVPLLLESKP